MDARPGNCRVVLEYQRADETWPTYTEVTVIYVSQTFTTFGLPCFSQIFQQGTNLIWVFEIVGSAVINGRGSMQVERKGRSTRTHRAGP
jgi:hypothetical protein